jgi:small subunit ribosomal protein S4
MARNIGPVCRMCRREGEKLFLKGARCFSPKCAFEKRGFPPGMHGKSTSARPDRVSDYGKQLRAKQKARREYGVFERQFRRYYSEALRLRGLTGMNLLQKLETRLDNVVYRLGFASSRAQARQLVNHGHFTVNGNRADIPSYDIRPDDVVTVSETSKETVYFKNLKEEAEARTIPTWIARDVNNFSGRVLRLPERSEIDGNLNEQLIVEYYSR